MELTELSVPREVREKYPKLQFTIVKENVYARMSVMKTRTLEDGTVEEYRSDKKVPVAKLVWNIHNPDNPLKKGKRLFHKNRNSGDNRYENLTTKRSMMRYQL